MSYQLYAPAALPPGKEPPGSHWIGGWVGPRTGLDDVVRRKILPLLGLQLRPLGRPATVVGSMNPIGELQNWKVYYKWTGQQVFCFSEILNIITMIKEWSTPRASWIKSTLLAHLHNIRINIILFVPSGLEIFRPKFNMHFSFILACRMSCQYHHTWFKYPNNIKWSVMYLWTDFVW
jgi:hypothetical protein